MDVVETLKQDFLEGRIDIDRLVAQFKSLQRLLQAAQQQLQATQQQLEAGEQTHRGTRNEIGRSPSGKNGRTLFDAGGRKAARGSRQEEKLFLVA
jgi:hypothetical protein